MEEEGAPVQLYVYDLSQGMARMLSMNLVGRLIEGIWHTSVVVYGTEHYFGQGVMESMPGRTHHGVPLQVIDMGRTHIPRDMFLEYLDGMKKHWTADKYHLLDNNCNNFSNELCNFLIGKNIPSHITALPAEFVNTPFGQSLLPVLENMFGPSQLARSANAAANAATAASPGLSPSLASLVGNVAAAAQSAPPSKTALQSAYNVAQLDSILASHRCVAIDFTSMSCGPCRVISPEFERLIESYNREYRQTGMGAGARVDGNKIVGVKVDVGLSRDIAQKYQITATPTFKFFLDGNEISQFKGANVQELTNSIELLLYSAYPPHPHTKQRTPILDSLPNSPILFAQSTQLNSIFNKLETFMREQSITDKQSQLDALKTALQAKHEKGQSGALHLPNGWKELLDVLLQRIPTEQLFPVLDILRLLILDEAIRDFYVKNDPESTVMNVLYRFGGQQAQPETVPKAVRVMVLRLACNHFTSPTSIAQLLSLSQTLAPHATPFRSVTTALLIDSLLSPDAAVRQCAASLAFNISIEEAKSRQSHAGVESGREDEGIHEEWVSELVAAIAKAFEDEEEDEIVLRLLTAIAHLLRFATPSIQQLATVIGVGTAVTQKRATREEQLRNLRTKGATGDAQIKKDLEKKEKIVGLAKEVVELL
ncbi:uncharacterized protein SPPG_01426 [Spizellomyces punctatus DAOM BR117]|uniref:PPPDE domain-containing protein n=1 Tax=Spizellomyces punctatus (strain DAOM BR117) TaxID=645134 RepID=A0A0L0HSC0_SPIPD|nr:uncharacterized protein SPPG_01426 [Spizellomyces punctatus DAOM BR117]KND03977.1 hypothetical protein SPPG_01426 [Spizellomyces punctatus DAOM BR117]|eukprot:XP_016612016.1 hypothetical protein SPPG_01426 [Spizellomyces punctatus DAOM BR117]